MAVVDDCPELLLDDSGAVSSCERFNDGFAAVVVVGCSVGLAAVAVPGCDFACDGRNKENH